MKAQVILFLIVMSMYGCQERETQVPVDTQKESEELMAISREWSKAAATKDVDKIVSYWADDAVLMTPGEPVYTGKEALREMVNNGFSNPGFTISWEPVSANVSASGDMAYILEKTKVTWADSLGNQHLENSNTVTIWRKGADGVWKAVVDISADLPA